MKTWSRTWPARLRPVRSPLCRRSYITDPETKYDINDSNRKEYESRKITDLLRAHEKGHLAAGEYVEVDSYIQSIRKQKKKAFAALQDGKSLDTLQAVMKPELAEG